MSKPGANRSAVTAFQLTGTDNIVRDNLYFNAVRVADIDDGIVTSNNIEADPKFINTGTSSMRATSIESIGFGHLPGEVTPTVSPTPKNSRKPKRDRRGPHIYTPHML